MTDKLSIYNGALRDLGERKLHSVQGLSENRESRRALDTVWDNDGVATCLEMGLWRFATNTIKITPDPDQTTDFGFKYAFSKPTDFVRTTSVASDEFFNTPLNQYSDEAGFWYANLDTIYVKYVSSSNSYGLNFARWPKNFTRMVECWFALQIVSPITQGEQNKESLQKDYKRLLTEAKSTDAMADPTSALPIGTWTQARRSGSNYRDRGNRNSLYG